MLSRLVERGDLPLVALARAKQGLTPSQRVLQSLNRFRTQPLIRLPDFVRVVEGDLEHLDLLRGSRDVTHVVHCAANTSFRSKNGVWRTNYEGTKALLARCEGMPRLERVLYVGTAMACGERPPGIVQEDEELAPDTPHIVEYTRSKAATERELISTSALPLITLRPSIVVGHSTLGVAPSASIWWYFRAVAALRFHWWTPDTRIDIVPVDWVAEALELLLLKKHLRWPRYHLSAGVTHSVDWGSLHRAMAGGSTPMRSERQELESVRAQACALFPGLDETRLMEALRAYYRFAALGIVFDTQRVSAEGLRPPPAFTSLIPRHLEDDARRSIEEQMRDDD